MLDHVAYLRLNPMFLLVLTDEVDDVPVLLGELEFLLLGQSAPKILRPVVQVKQITFCIGVDLRVIDPERLSPLIPPPTTATRFP
jgi:hypothetical protein